MIDPLLPNAIIKTRLLENILEIIKSNDEKFLDISIVCEDGSFLWSQFLLAAASDLFAAAMQGIEVTQVIFPDLQVEYVRGSLLGLLYNTPRTKIKHENHFIEFLKKINSHVQDSMDINFCIDTELVKSEIDEIIQGEDLDLINNGEIQLNFLQLEPLEQSTAQLTNIKVEDQSNKNTLKSRNSGKVNQTDIKTEKMLESAKGYSYRCNMCEYLCTTLSLLKEHKKTSHKGEFLDIPCVNDANGDMKFKCEFCEQKCGKKCNIIDHVRLHHKNDFKSWIETVKQKKVNGKTVGINRCNMCEFMCTHVSLLKEHKETCHPGEFLDIPCVEDVNGDRKFKCEFCEKTCGKKCNIIDHVRLHHKNDFKSWIKTVKKKKVKGEQIQSTKGTNNDKNASYRCSMCEYMCTNLSILKEHKKTSHQGEFIDIPCMEDVNGDMKFKCEFCEQTCGKKSNVIDHVRVQHKNDFKSWIETVKKNKECSTYASKQLKHFYKKDGNLFKCNLCNETFHALLDFKKHISTVHKDKYGKELDFICDVCGDGFLRRSGLNHHVLIHLPPVKCPECDKVFTTSLSLKKHQKFSCKNEVALKFCELCGKGFKTDYTLKVHNNRVHLNHRPFKCTICSNAFKTLVHFQTHCTGKHNIEKEKCKQYLLRIENR